jgi:hypothetical protein
VPASFDQQTICVLLQLISLIRQLTISSSAASMARISLLTIGMQGTVSASPSPTRFAGDS